METTPESRPPRQNFNLHADAPRQNLARQNVWQGDCGKECPTPEFTEATQRLFQHVVAWRLQLCCTEPAYGPVTTLHRACNYVAQDAYGCMGPAIMLHRYSIWLQRACTYAAQVQHMAAWGLHLCCTGPACGCMASAIVLHRATRWVHSCTGPADGCMGLAVLLHRASMWPAIMLHTYLIPQCVGGGVSLGSESSSVSSVWKSGNQGTCESGKLRTSKQVNYQNQNYFCPKCLQDLDL